MGVEGEALGLLLEEGRFPDIRFKKMFSELRIQGKRHDIESVPSA